MLLALLEAGYDADAPNLGCPCLCCCPSCQATTPRQIADSWWHCQNSHTELLDHTTDARVQNHKRIMWDVVDDELVPHREVDGKLSCWIPLEQIQPQLSPDAVH